MIISKSEIELYIPQRAPFIMIDNLIAATSEKFETDFRINQDNIFVQDGILREFALIENIAQSSSVGLVVTKKYTSKKNLDGFIGGITKLKLYDLPKVNDTIHTIVTLLAQFEKMFLLKGENFLKGKKLLECEVKLVGI
jgi:predicted hotdog family 3-hydroxylacyl-ACP dehydratase